MWQSLPVANQSSAVAHMTDLINPITAKLFNLNFHPLDIVSR